MAANEYWLKRLKRDRALADRAADQVADKVRHTLRGQYYQTAKKLEGLYEEARRKGELSRTKLWEYRRGLDLEKRLREFADDFSVFQVNEIRGVMDRVFQDTIGASVDAFRQDKFVLPYDPRAVIDTAWSGEQFSSRVWKNTNQLALRIRAEAEQVLLGEKSIAQIKRQLMHDFDVARSDADRLIDTEVSYVMNKANLLQYERGYGFRKVTITTLDVETCEKCKALEGEVFDIRDAPMVPIHPRCRCSYCVPEDGDEAEITASGADLDEVYARKGVKGYAKAKQYAPKGAKAAEAQPIPASALQAKIDKVIAAAEQPKVELEKAKKAEAPPPAEIVIPQAPAAVAAPAATEPAAAPIIDTQGAKTLANAALSAAAGLQEGAESGIIEAYKEKLEKRTIVINSEVENGLPIKGEPDEIADLVDDEGNVLKRRVHGADGMAAIDYDTGDHNRPDVHTTGAHKHIFDYTKKRPRGKNLPLTTMELLLNSDIIREGVNYFAGGKTH